VTLSHLGSNTEGHQNPRECLEPGQLCKWLVDILGLVLEQNWTHLEILLYHCGWRAFVPSLWTAKHWSAKHDIFFFFLHSGLLWWHEVVRCLIFEPLINETFEQSHFINWWGKGEGGFCYSVCSQVFSLPGSPETGLNSTRVNGKVSEKSMLRTGEMIQRQTVKPVR
jgi:hypothetical protein